MAAEFSGTVVDCRTRFQVDKPTTAYVAHGFADWILTVSVDTADGRLPFPIGQKISFAIHSPVQLLFDSAEECVGKRYRFSVELAETGRPRWQTLTAMPA